jgi:hypothetical protein
MPIAPGWNPAQSMPSPKSRRRSSSTRSDGVTVRPDGPYALALTWPKPKVGRIDHYSVYASPTASPKSSNETLVGSTRGVTRFRDTGLRPESQVYYLVVGYDSRGRKVCAYRGSGKSADLRATQTVRLKAADARLDPALERVEEAGRVFVRVSKDAEAGQRSASVRYPFEVSEAGDYAVWIDNRPHSRNNQVRIAVGQDNGYCRLERYMRPGARVESMSIGGKPLPERRWYVKRVTFGRRAPAASADVFHLEGPQEIVVSLDIAGQKPRSLDLGDVIVTNDLTWRPDDYDPRTQFVPEE